MHAAAETLLFKTLADPTRRALFERLAREGELTVGALTRRAGVSQPAVSQHLEALRQAGGHQPARRPHGALPRHPARASAAHQLAGALWRVLAPAVRPARKLLKEMDQ